MNENAPPDVMDRLAGLAPGSPLAALRQERADVARFIERSDAAIFTPKHDGGLTPAERAAAAARIAKLLHDETLAIHYRQRLGSVGNDTKTTALADPAASAIADPRLAAIAAHIDRVTREPSASEKGHIDALLAAGLTPQAVLALSQVIAFVNFQSRVLATLKALRNA